MNIRREPERKEELEIIKKILKNWEGEKNMIAILLSIQDNLGYLPEEGMMEVARHLNISETTIYGVATFYNQFRFTPPGKNHIQVCMGTACHVKRGNIVLDSWERRLEIKEGEVSEDREFSLDRVNCVGCCVLAPVTVINKEVYGKMDTTKVDGILLKYQLGKEAETKRREASETGTIEDGEESDNGNGS
ncbi:MAG: NAD(P)H-dependent oxidoreductase subunit E [Thermodesulfobacteriota bacterium]